MIKSLSYKFTNLLINNEIIEYEDFEIYRYGFETLIYFIFNISVALIIGTIFNRFVQTIIFLSCYCTLRQFTGGYHAKNYLECTLTFALIYLLTIFIDIKIDINKYPYLLILVIFFSIYIIYKLAPLDHRNKPLSIDEKSKYKKMVMKISTIISRICVFSLICNIFVQYIMFSAFALLWIAILLIIGYKKL